MSQDTTAGPGVEPPKRGGERNTVGARMTAKQRATKALALRLRRVSYDEIARQLGYSHRSAARKAVERELASIPREAAKELRQQELETLDAVQAKLMPLLLDRARPQLGAIDRLVKVMDHRAKLTGIHENLTDSGVDEFKAVLLAWRSEITKQADADAAEDEAAEAAATAADLAENPEGVTP